MLAPSAIDAFVRHITEARARLDVLQGFLEDHMGYGPDDINWSHVGSAAAVNGALIELMTTAGIDPDGIDDAMPNTPWDATGAHGNKDIAF